MKPDPDRATALGHLAVIQMLKSAEKWNGLASFHEAMAVLREEYEELWELCKMRQADRVYHDVEKEALDVAAVAIEIAALAHKEEWLRR